MLDAALRALAALVALVPSLGALAAPGRLVGWLAGSVLRIRRRQVEEAMARAGLSQPAAEARAMYAGLGVGALELVWLAGASGARRTAALEQRVVFDDDFEPAVDRALARGPIVFAASHTGNWETAAFAAARLLAARGRRLAVVAKPLSVSGFDAFCTRLRRACGLELLTPRGAFARCREALARGDAVAMPIDQVPERERHAVHASFLGASARVDRAPAVLAARAGATLLVVAAARDSAGVQTISVLAALRPDGCPDRTAFPEHASRTATVALDAFVRRHPSSWLWLHRRWRAPRERAARGRLVASPHPG